MLLRLASAALVLAAVAVGGCRGSGAGKTITVAGSTTVLPIAQAAAEEFMEEHGGFKVLVQGGGSSAGIEAAYTGTAEIGDASRELKPEESDWGLVIHPVAIDVIAVVTDRSNPVGNLTSAQARRIFAGKITNWKEVGGADRTIVLINRDEGSGTREAFKKKVMEDLDFDQNAIVLPGSGQVRMAVARTPGAIGYMSLGYLDPSVKALGVDGVPPTELTAKSGSYKLQRRLLMLTKGPARGEAKSFIDFILSPRIQRGIVSTEFLPVK